jgi:hypothetical protein
MGENIFDIDRQTRANWFYDTSLEDLPDLVATTIAEGSPEDLADLVDMCRVRIDSEDVQIEDVNRYVVVWRSITEHQAEIPELYESLVSTEQTLE